MRYLVSVAASFFLLSLAFFPFQGSSIVFVLLAIFAIFSQIRANYTVLSVSYLLLFVCWGFLLERNFGQSCSSFLCGLQKFLAQGGGYFILLAILSYMSAAFGIQRRKKHVNQGQ